MPTASLAIAQQADDSLPWRLDRALETPEWLRLSGYHRTRFESLNGQFRTGILPSTEDQLLTRTSLLAEFDLAPLGGSIELMDSRAFSVGGDGLTSSGSVNATDFVQANATLQVGEHGRLLVGRYTMALGSRRLVIRNVFRNTVNNFTGVDYRHRDPKGNELRAFWTMPVRRRPFDATSLRDNDFDWDDQDEDLQFFGMFGTHQLDERTRLEGYAYGLLERGGLSRRRELVTPGVRLQRAKAPNNWSYELEAALQFGNSRTAATGPDLDHLAYMAHASLGYSFSCPLRPHLRLAFDYASGDADPTDGDNGRFDTLFGAPRFDYGPTSLWGAIQRSNLASSELRITIHPTERTRLMVAWRDLRLAESRDLWTASGVVDPTGSSGTSVGQHFEFLLRYDISKDNLYVEVGGAYLVGGSFVDRAPNAVRRGDSRVGYVEVVTVF